MKTRLLILLLIVAAILLTASTPVKRQTISGVMHWTRSSICGLQDYVSTETMENIYLTGLGFPTKGEMAGCKIRAEGFFLKGLDYCRVFSVENLYTSCPVSVITP